MKVLLPCRVAPIEWRGQTRGAVVIAGVLNTQVQEAASLGADQVVATDDDNAMANLPQLDAVADTVCGNTAEKLIAKVKRGGLFASVLGAPQNAKQYPAVKVVLVLVYANPDAKILLYMAQAVKAGRLKIPIERKLSLKDADKGHAAVAKGGVGGKLLLVLDEG
jgi:NADPH:quinone reductase-like Zn-dependent oxidoreductase